MKKLLLISLVVWCAPALSQIFTEDFESGSGGYSSSITECTDNGTDYFLLTDGSNIGATFTGTSGSFFAAQDIDATGCPVAPGATATLTWTGININGCTGISLSVDLAEDDDGTNEDWDAVNYVHIDYQIDGGGYQNGIWVENDGTAFNSAPYIDTDYDGTGDGTEITDTWQTFTQALAGTGAALDIRITIFLDDGDEDIAIDNLIVTGAGCGGCPGLAAEPTVDISGDSATPACASASIDWTNGNNDNTIVVFSTSPITWTPTDGVNYNVGDTPSAGVTVIYDGSGNSAGVTGLTPGTTYYYAIFGYDGTLIDCEENFLVGGQTGSFTTNTGCASSYIQSINYNACNGSNEGTDEIIFVQVGNNAVNVDDMVIDLPNSSWCNSGCGANTIVNNQTYLDDLNTLAGCTPDLFVYCDPIPAGSALMIFTGNPPSTVIDYSNNCSGQQYCAIFLDNSDLTGNYSNTSTSTRTTTIDFGNGDVSTATFTPGDGLCNCDGASVNFDEDGNITEYVQNTDCIYPLALNIRTLSGYKKENVNVVEWMTDGDNTASYFELESSETGENWKIVQTVSAERPTNFGNFYQVEDNKFYLGNTYYRLVMYDATGLRTNSNIISIERDAISTFLNENKLTVGFSQHPNKSYTLNIYDVTGALIHSEPAENGMTIEWSYKGLFVVEIPEKEARQKLIAQ